MKPTIDATTLRDIFQKKYDRKEWVNVLREVFMVSDIYATPKYTGIHNDDWGAKVYELGNFETKEGRLVGIYEVPINNKVKLERNKIGLRNLLKSVYKEDVDAAFIIFDQGAKWRFSYVSEISVKDPHTKKRLHKKTDPKRYTYIMGEGERCKTAADRFSRIQQSENLSDVGIELKTIEDAFSVEKLSKSFFEGYKKLYGQFVAFLTGHDESGKQVYHPKHGFLKSTFHDDEKAARDFVKKMMGRIVFLYFLEKKGWLGVPENANWGDGLQNFLSDLFNDCAYKEDFYTQVLVPLFFDTLNTDRANDLFKIKSGTFTRGNYSKLKIPFLNGGLFDSEAEETQLLVFKKEYFEELFHFFDQYNFTVYEDSPEEHTVAVDPEMLGHIFENLLEDNKDKGAFYTPKEIVHYMCQESLIEYLHTKLNPDTGKEIVSHAAIENFIKHREAGDIIKHDEALLNALREVKICDPAIGSGAFPMGLLHEIFYAVELLNDVTPNTTAKVWKLKKWDPAKVKLAIIENSIYGVDIEQGAVDIARLRFWLSLVVDEEKPQPLPNFDYKIVVGDSLLPKLKIDGEEEVIEINWGLGDGTKGVGMRIHEEQKIKQISLKEKQHLYFNVKVGKVALHKEIEGLKADILINQLAINKEIYSNKNPLKGGFAPTPKDIQANHERELELLKFDTLISKLKEVKKRKEDVCFFDWKFTFPEVMTAGVNKTNPGFDIVIGNPPYLSTKGIKANHKKLLQSKFISAKGQFDLYGIFLEKGLDLSKYNSTLTMITSNTFLSNKDFKSLRKILIQKTSILQIINLGETVFDSADVDVAISILKNAVIPDNYISVCKNDAGFLKREFIKVPQNSFDIEANNFEIQIGNDLETATLLGKLFSFNNTLGDFLELPRGIEIGANSEKIISSFKKGYQKLLVGRDIKRYATLFNERYIEFENDFSVFKDPIIYSNPKILIQRIRNLTLKQRIVATLDTDGYLCTNTLRIGNKKHPHVDLKLLLGILNSKVVNYLFLNTFFNKDIYAYQLQRIPIPFALKYENSETQNISKSVDKILKTDLLQTEINRLENAIDLAVYHLYSLCYDEACIIEGNTEWMSKKDYENYKL